MIHASAYQNSLLFEDTHSGRCLARVKNMCFGAFYTFHIFIGHCRNAAHTLHYIKHETLRLQQRTHFSAHNHSYITGFYGFTVIDKHLNRHCRIKPVKHLFCHLDTSQDTVLLYKKMRFTHRIFRYATQCGMISVTYVFCKSKIYKTFLQFVYT